MKKENNDPKPQKELIYEVPPGGSLGLLALGYRGLLAWREALEKYKEENPQAKKNGKKKN